MIILPASTPAASIDQHSVTQTQVNHTQSLEDSRKATDTVKISAEAQHLAGSLVKDKQPDTNPDPSRVMANEAKQSLQEAPKAEQPRNPVTQVPEGNNIDVVS